MIGDPHAVNSRIASKACIKVHILPVRRPVLPAYLLPRELRPFLCLKLEDHKLLPVLRRCGEIPPVVGSLRSEHALRTGKRHDPTCLEIKRPNGSQKLTVLTVVIVPKNNRVAVRRPICGEGIMLPGPKF